MKKSPVWAAGLALALAASGCSTAYEVTPISYRVPSDYGNAAQLFGAEVGGRLFADPDEAEERFGFDIIGAGLLPVQLAFDNQGETPLSIEVSQTFLVDVNGSIWPILDRSIAHDRGMRYSPTRDIFQSGAYGAFLGAALGSLVGAAVGVVEGDSVAQSAGRGAAAGIAVGGAIGGVQGAQSGEVQQRVEEDMARRSLNNRIITPGALTYGLLFFPAEAKNVQSLRLQLRNTETDAVQTVTLPL